MAPLVEVARDNSRFSCVMTAQSRAKLVIKGQVQGVGFRPYVYQLAKTHQLTGWVCNTGEGVTLEVQGAEVPRFIESLSLKLPPLARMDEVKVEWISLNHQEDAFIIHESIKNADYSKIPPDVKICEACLNELFDPDSRFYGYPFLNCTQCGPRYSITRQLPYDRCQTSMDAFPLCEQCHADYHDPANRRFHAQPTACSKCGPQLSDSMDAIVQQIQSGKILAIKGLGGYQLICDARNDIAVLALRRRKQRLSKPFALMALNLETIDKIGLVSQQEKALLADRAAPIVLLSKKNDIVSSYIAPGLTHLGFMLPYTPLHYLIFHALAGYPKGVNWLNEYLPYVLVVTSANASGNPLVFEDEIAKIELKAIADTIVTYNRHIVTRLDDSVIRIIHDHPVFIRRARGFVPEPVKLPQDTPSVLAVGGYLKNTVCVTRRNEAFVSQHIGDLKNAETVAFFHETIKRLVTYLNVKPEYLIHDHHPDYYSTQFAQHQPLPAIAVQHHHAHLAAVAAEHHLEGKILGLALDGFGWGEDGMAWGGELFLFDCQHYQRLGSLLPMRLPGGDVAAREPWRMAASILFQLNLQDQISKRFKEQKGHAMLAEVIRKGVNSPLTTSCGRLFDAASALLELCPIADYEGQAAMLLEAQVTQPQVLQGGWIMEDHYLNLLPLMSALLMCTPEEGANLFHGTLAKALASWVNHWAKKLQINAIVLSGGCFLNQFLPKLLIDYCLEYGLLPYIAKALPPSDAGISLGQAWVGANRVIATTRKDVDHVLSYSSKNYCLT
ncbi:carbamoyltransferase HypF [Aquicella lusitana]|uniref:Carbamoyltransferase HypF n=1 Tax=Aquicella lusitana TaxID=254246 RepID=A0A370GID6_9COXI|nr:carbamoyltransferase HypF [Aquicella lusitana]RDI43417.1 hydrogenase maturation carbamoyltransferase HypF [Aquicella lusitana]VVC73567.1 Carbamoyltransferase HypF [Aquicella lusitana]